MTPAIRVQNLSKCYHLQRASGGPAYRTLREDVMTAVMAPVRWFRGRNAPRPEPFCALRDVSFEVPHGEVTGLIGPNGAGKSTLLKILSRITRPTSGSAAVRGRVGSLLEVGTGFHPELTGRENIFLNGTLLGMKRREIRSRFETIVAFAEIEQFLDQPVKHYSSGMFMRLAFSVAAHLEPEVLLIDEVLAVGDAGFQRKCLGKMGNLATCGRTILFVSHNMPAVKNLCRTAIVLSRGRMRCQGPVAEAVQSYLNDESSAESQIRWPVETAPGTEKARLLAVRVLADDAGPAEHVAIDKPLSIQIEYEVLRPGIELNLSISLFTQDDVHVLASPSLTDPNWFQKPHPAGTYRSQCEIPANLLNEGRYFISVFLVERANLVVARADRAVSIEMVDGGLSRGGYFETWRGVVRPRLAWNTQCLPTD